MCQLILRPTLWDSLFCFGCILSMFGSTSSSNPKDIYNYAIDVRPVDRCPMSKSDWQAAAKRTGCNGTRGYHCVPDKFHSSLIEFCYNKTRILVNKGNCLELAANGVLNYVKCHEFTEGCPDQHYFSDQIYQYQFCLSLVFRCFAADIKCLTQKFEELQKRVKHSDCTSKDNKENDSLIIIIIFVWLFLLLACSGIFIFMVRKSQRQMRPVKREVGRSDDLQVLGKLEDDLQVLGKVEGELVFEDIYLSLLLRRHCRNGVFKNFIYLLETRIMKKKDGEYDVNLLKILTSRDKEGHTLLHCAAEGGSQDIVEALVKAMVEVNKHSEIKDKIEIDDTTYDGLTVLHIACKNKHHSLCRYFLTYDNYKDLLLYKKSKQGWNAAHFAAVGGDKHIIDLLEGKNLDIRVQTKNGLNILDIACIHNNIEIFNDLMNHQDLSLLLHESDARGWTIVHFTAMLGNTEIFDHLIKKNVDIVKTKNEKNILHICCEYGHKDLCKTILKHFGTMVNEKDDEDWNALHYAAKGGNLRVFREIEKNFAGDLCETTRDERTVLHIACINNRTDICKYICKKKSYESIINSTGEFRGWTAAHYVAVEERHDGTEQNIIRTLIKGGIDLYATTVDRLTVLGVACEHRNRRLINYLLNNHDYLLAVETDALKAAAKTSNDDYILTRMTEAVEIYRPQIFNSKANIKSVDKTLADNLGSEESLVFLS